MKLTKAVSLTAIVFSSAAAVAQSPSPAMSAKQDVEAIKVAALEFLKSQTAAAPGETHISIGAINPNLNVNACSGLTPFLPAGVKLWGRITIGISCAEPSRWSIYIPATIRVTGDYIAARKPIAGGSTITEQDIVVTRGELTAIAGGYLSDPKLVIGRTTSINIPSGTPLSQDKLKTSWAFQQGQTVRAISKGTGFSVSTDAIAISSAKEGQIAQVKTASGAIISGIAKSGGIVELTH